MCVMCPAAGFIGGSIGGYFGIPTPKTTRNKLFSALTAASLTVITVVALKRLCHFSLCGGERYHVKSFGKVVIKTCGLGVAYSILVNYLFHSFFEPKEPSAKDQTCCDGTCSTNRE